jgi:hypothetical protein
MYEKQIVAPKCADHSVIKNDKCMKNKQIAQKTNSCSGNKKEELLRKMKVAPKCADHSVIKMTNIWKTNRLSKQLLLNV